MSKPNYTQAVSRTETGDGSTLPDIRKVPTVLYGIFVELARNVFGTEIGEGKLPVWYREPNTTGIWIDTEHAWEDEAPNFRPAVYVGLSDINYTNLGNLSGQTGMRLEEAEYQFAIKAVFSVHYSVTARTKSEAILLAEALSDVLMAVSRPIRQVFCFDKFGLAVFHPGMVDKEHHEVYISRATFGVEFQESWTLKLESPKLKKLVFDAGHGVSELLD